MSDDKAELPRGWAWTTTDVLFSYVTSGSRGWAKFYSDAGALFLRMGNLDHNSISLDLADLQKVKPPQDAEGERTRVKPNDILISITADVGMIGTKQSCPIFQGFIVRLPVIWTHFAPVIAGVPK